MLCLVAVWLGSVLAIKFNPMKKNHANPQRRHAAPHFHRRKRPLGTQPAYEAIVLKAREMHMAGATVLRGPMGFGKTSRLHTAKILRLSMDLPLVIEIVDSEEKISAFLPVLDE